MLNELLESLSKQTREINQIVVIDDGGPGSAKEIVDKYGSNFQYYWQPNGGQQNARNYGARKVSEKWVAFVDDDDIWELNRNEIISSIADNEKVDLIVSDFSIFNDAGTICSSLFEKHKHAHPVLWKEINRSDNETYSIFNNLSPLTLFPEYPFWGTTIAIKMEKFHAIGQWDESLRGIPSEDLDFVFRAIKNSRIGIIWATTIRYRSHLGNVANDPIKKLSGRAQIAKRLIDKKILNPEETNFTSNFIRRSQLEVIWSYYASRNYRGVLNESKRISTMDLTLSSIVKIFFSYIIIRLFRV